MPAKRPCEPVRDDILVEALPGEESPREDQHVTVRIGSQDYFVSKKKNKNDEDLLHVKIDSNDMVKEIGQVLVKTNWGWNFTPRLAVAFVAKIPFLTPDGKFIALFDTTYIRGGSEEDKMSLQWVKVPDSSGKLDKSELLKRCAGCMLQPEVC